MRKMVRSPLNSPHLAQIRRDAILAKATGDLMRMHETLLKKVGHVEQLIGAVHTEAARISKLPKGEKGDRGPTGLPGITKSAPSVEQILAKIQLPKDGKDGVSPSIEEVAKRVIGMIRTPQDGKDAVLDEGKIIDELFKRIQDEKHFDWKKVPGLANEIASYRNQLAGKQYGKDTWARGGGTTVSAGSNITLVPQPNGTVQINASGGGSGTNVVTQYRLTAVQVAANVTINLTQLTNWATFDDLIAAYRNNIMQTETVNFTLVGSTLTIFEASADEVFNVTYAYL